MVEIPVMVMKAGINIQEDKVAETMEVAEIQDMTVIQIMGMVVVVATNLQGVEDMVTAVLIGVPVAEIGVQEVMKDALATVDIPKINI